MKGGLDPALQGHLLVGLSGPVLSGVGAWPRGSAPGEGPACIPRIMLYLPSLTGCHTCPGPYLPHGGPCLSLLCASLVTLATFAETLQVLLNSQEPPDWRGSVLPHPSHRPAAQLHPQSPPCARSLALVSFRGWGSIWSQLRLLPLPHPASRLQIP